MATNFQPSAACCSTPVAVVEHYEPKGKFLDVDGTKTYMVGPESAQRALFVLYDVFGYSPQILQGADILADAGYKIFMPDFWDGRPAPLSWMPFDGPADEAKLDEFCNGPGETIKTLERIGRLRLAFERLTPGIEKWGLLGYCWGGYVSSFAVGSDTAFSACAQAHPGFPSPLVGSQITVPVLALCSKDEPESEFADFRPALKVANRFALFPEMVHGWLSARADMGKAEVRRDFRRGYEMILEWFGEHM